MAAPTLKVEEYQYTDGGVLLNGTSALPFVDVTSVEGLDSAPARTQTHDREGTDGGFVDSEFETIRTVSLEGYVYTNPSSMETYLDSLKANYAPSKNDQPFYFRTDAGLRLVFGKAQGFKYTKDPERGSGKVAFQIQIICGDSRIYSDPAVTASVSGSGSTTLTLGGNRPSLGKLTISGASTNPSISCNGSTFSFSLSTGAGDSLVIDLDTRTVILNGGTSKRGSMSITGGWFSFVPGNNPITYSGGGTLTVNARSAWR